ncbi:lysylphosphatidylglycerol synthase transmembrane domain-containing protein [Desulfonatronum thiodismutans]|uniref:lysylphosphatidylglycerol synthase transmembrane domain-containing protein n=1 Tax=Desulfonatronum thiodismutans TaxID=159290 RepID=UPI0004ABDEF4|nr:lysylphosphatidylglycerol synthase transmembrane domain-containing protein [Desulfonatronum thiodismutans]
MTRPLRNHLKLLLRVVLSLGLLGALAYTIDLSEMAWLMVGLRWELFMVLLLLVLGERLLSTWKWRVLLNIHGSDLSLWQLFRIQMTSVSFGLFLPSSVGVDVLRMVAISRCSTKPVQAVAASAADRAISVFIHLFLAAAAALLAAGSYLPWPMAIVFPLLFFGASGVILVLAHPILNKWVAPLLRRTFGDKITDKLKEFYSGLRAYRDHKRALLANTVIFALMIILRISIVYTQAMALNIDVNPWLLAMVLPLIFVALMLPVSIGGLGLQEGAYFAFLGAIGVAGSAAVAISILEHVIVRLASLPGFYFYLRGGLVGGEVTSQKTV